jgi:hypothetical protein
MEQATSTYITCRFSERELRDLLNLPSGDITAVHMQHDKDQPPAIMVVIRE